LHFVDDTKLYMKSAQHTVLSRVSDGAWSDI